MIKVNCGFSRKVGEPNYGSRGASVNLELELATEAAHDADALQDKIKRMFVLAKKAVDDELNGQSAPSEPAGSGDVPDRQAPGNGNGNGNGHPAQGSTGSAATNKQVKLIMDLARTRKMSMSVIERLCQETCGVSDVYGLSKTQASAVIDRLKQDERTPAGRR